MKGISYRKQDRIAYITLDRPNAKNAIDGDMDSALWEAWADFRDDSSVDLAILSATGDIFCAGLDVKTYLPELIREANAATPRERVAHGVGGLTRGLHRIYKPIIAAVNGPALGAGLELALACDLRVASANATFGAVEVRVGLHAGDGGIIRLINACGAAVAFEALLTGEPLSAERALQLGIVNWVISNDQLEQFTLELAQKILRNDQWALRSGKQTILDAIGRPLDEQLALEAANCYSGLSSRSLRSRFAVS